MAKRVTAIEDRMLQLALDVFKVAPEQYYKNPNDRDPLNAAWNETMDTTRSAMHTLADLGNLVREKAGINEPGPVARWRAERKKKSEEPVVSDGEGI